MTDFLKRWTELIPTLIGVSLVTFFLMRMTPGDPVKMMLGPEATAESIELKRKELGFDKPLHVQYVKYMWGVIRLDLGKSITSGRTVNEEVFGHRMIATFQLGVVSMFFALVTGISIGVFSAVYPRSLLDSISRVGVFIFLAMPAFWLGLELIILLSRHLKWFPPGGRGEDMFPGHPIISAFLMSPSVLGHLMLPAITLGVGTGAFLSRILRSSMLQVLNMDYVRTARAKGLNEKRVIFKHALKNAMIPFVTIAGLSTGSLLGGAVIVETVFNWPGLGKLLVDSIRERDFPVTMGTTLVLAVIFVVVNFVVDFSYAWLDPRIRVGGGKA